MDVSGNNVLELPGWVTGMADLGTLEIDYNVNIRLGPFSTTGPYLGVLDVSGIPGLKLNFSMPAIHRLSATSCGISEVPEDLATLAPVLEFLQVSTNPITRLPAVMPPQLSELYCVQCMLEDLPEIPKLVRLDLTKNRLVGFPPSIARMPRLLRLILSDNSLVTVSPLSNLTSLIWCFLDDNYLTNVPFSSFRGLSSLQTLNLASNMISSLPDLTDSAATLKELILSSNELGQDESILRTLSALEELTVLDVSSNGLTGHAIPCLPGLVKLFAQDNSITTVGHRGSAAPCSMPLLVSANLDNNRLADVDFLMNSSSVINLDISHNPLGEIGLVLTRSLPLLETFRAANLSMSAVTLSTALSELGALNASLVLLDLSDNTFVLGGLSGSELAAHRSTRFPVFSRLSTISLSRTNIVGRFNPVTEGYLAFPLLRNLDLSFNPRLTFINQDFQWLTGLDLRGSPSVRGKDGSSRPFMRITTNSLAVRREIVNSRKAICDVSTMFGSAVALVDPDSYGFRFCQCLDYHYGLPWGPSGCASCPAITGATCADSVLTLSGSWPLLATGRNDSRDGVAGAALESVPCPSNTLGIGTNPCGDLLVRDAPHAHLTANESARWLAENVPRCRPGYSGRLCSRCSRGHYRKSSYTCHSCSGFPTFVIEPLLSAAFIVFLAIKILAGGTTVRSGLFRTGVLHLQLFSVLPRQSGFALPAAVRSFFGAAEVSSTVSIDGLECLTGGQAFSLNFWWSALTPLITVITAVCVVAVDRAVLRLRKRWLRWRRRNKAGGAFATGQQQQQQQEEEEEEDGRAEGRTVRQDLLFITPYVWLFLVFVALRKVSLALSCTSYGDSFGKKWVSTAMDIACDASSGRYLPLALFGGLSTVGFLLATGVILWRFVAQLNTSRRLSRFHHYLAGPYRRNHRGWEAVQVSRRLSLSLVQGLVPFHSLALPLLITLLLTVSLVLHSYRRPYKARSANIAESISLTILLVTYTLGIVASERVSVLDPIPRIGEAVAWIILLVNLIFVLCIALLLTGQWVKGRRDGAGTDGAIDKDDEDTQSVVDDLRAQWRESLIQ